MGFINILIGSNCYLNIENKQLKLKKKDMDEEITYPTEDINSVVIDNLQSTISTKTLLSLTENNIITYFCDDKHLPQAYLLAYNAFYKNLDVYKKQVNVKKPVLKNIWKSVVEKKILNQVKVLNYLGVQNNLGELVKLIQSGDSTNVEAVAANKYFKLLFNNNFTRHDENAVNSALNYGYAIIRGAIARSLTAHGLLPFLGMHHCNKLNNFNLVDDLIEPFRPIVDLMVIQNVDLFETQLNKETKLSLINLLNCDMELNNQKMCISFVIDKVIESYINSLNNNENKIKLPNLIGISTHCYE